jgi:hypothetical protein
VPSLDWNGMEKTLIKLNVAKAEGAADPRRQGRICTEVLRAHLDLFEQPVKIDELVIEFFSKLLISQEREPLAYFD